MRTYNPMDDFERLRRHGHGRIFEVVTAITGVIIAGSLAADVLLKTLHQFYQKDRSR